MKYLRKEFVLRKDLLTQGWACTSPKKYDYTSEERNSELFNSCCSYMASFQESRILYVFHIVSASQIRHPRGSQGLSIGLKQTLQKAGSSWLSANGENNPRPGGHKDFLGNPKGSWVLEFRLLTWYSSWFWSFERWLYYSSSVDRGPITFKDLLPIKTQHKNYRGLWLVNWGKREISETPPPSSLSHLPLALLEEDKYKRGMLGHISWVIR